MSRPTSLRSLLVVPAAAVGSVLLSAAPAMAHVGHGADGTASGLLHPITGIDHLLAMVAVGVVAATTSTRRSTVLAPAAFLAGMLLGGVAGLAGVPLPGAELLIVASVIALGIAVAGAVETHGRAFGPVLALLAVAGMAHGHAHGVEAPSAVHPALYVAGFLATSAALHAAGAGVGAVIRDRRTIRLGLGLTTVAAGALLLV